MNHLAMPVEEFTTPSPLTAKEDTPIESLHQMMKEHNVRHIPILRDGRVTGIVSERDIKVASGLTSKERSMVRAADIMAREPVTVSAGARLDEVAFEMAENKIGSVIVNDEDDNFYGIFTVTDALNALIEIARDSEINQ